MNIKSILHSSLIALSAISASCFIIFSQDITAYSEETNEAAMATTQAAPVDITINKANSQSQSDITAVMTDGSYDTTCNVTSTDYLSIEANAPIYGIYILWDSEVADYTLSYKTSDGTNSDITCGMYGYMHDYIPIKDGAASVTIRTSADMSVSDIYAYSYGTPPDSVQIWQPPCEDDTDILVFSTHADDEILFLGGVLTNYGGEQGLNVQVAYMCDFFLTEPVRQHEELDGLWECGITHYPVNGGFMDLYSLDLETAMTQYDYDDIVSYAVSSIRRFKPLVCVSQDFNGEYGHGNHRIYAKAVADAVNSSANTDFNEESADTYGIWDVPKTYYHLYDSHTILLDVDSPLDRFNGDTSVDVLKRAFKKHVSQISYSFNVMDNGYAKTYWGNYNSRSFGLYRTNVGYDTGNDMMENVMAIHKEREEKKAAKLAASTAAMQTEAASDDSGSNTDTTDKANTPDIKQLAITLIAILIIGAVICGQAYRTRNLYKKKYNDNKNEFNKQ